MGHKFNPKNKNVLSSVERLKDLPPDKILQDIGVERGSLFVDVGCGTGHFSLPALDIVGKEGKVYALDVSQEMLDSLIDKSGSPKGSNLKTLRSREYEFLLSAEIADYVLMSSVLHEVDNPTRFLEEGIRVLKKQGKIIVIEWIKADMDSGPPKEHRISLDETKKIVNDLGLAVIRASNINEKYYMIVCEK